jgi:methylthioribulose-1-phosphate dehydratase
MTIYPYLMDSSPVVAASAALIRIGREFHRRGWSLATSSNYSAVLGREPLRLLLTGSGFDKGRLRPENFVEVDERGMAVAEDAPKPSAETLLHVVLARVAGAGAVLHTHSVWGTLLSEACVAQGKLQLKGYEMLKALPGVKTHECTVALDVFPNTQDIADLAARVEARLKDPLNPLRHGFLIAGHGLYTWGRDLAQARIHIEALEFLFEVVGRKASISSSKLI